MTTNGSRFNSLKQSCYEIMRNLFIGEELVVEDNHDNMIEQNNQIVENNENTTDTETDNENAFII